MRKKKNRPKVIMIISHGHSGSTLLDKVIGNHKEGFSLGEVLHYSRLASSNEVHCGCSKLYADCPFWQSINTEIKNLKKIASDDDIKINFNTHNNFLRRKTFLKDFFSFLTNTLFGSVLLEKRKKKSLYNTGELYKVVLAKEAPLFLVDSSKRIDRAIYLYNIFKDEFDFKFVHLVRDGRSVLGSFHRKKITFELKDQETGEVKTFIKKKKETSPTKIIWSWLFWNMYISIALKRLSKQNRLFVRYEDFTQNPHTIVKKICNQFQIPFNQNMVDISRNTNHMMGGHASRVNAKTINPAKKTWDQKVPQKMIAKFNRISGWLNRIYGY